VAWRLDTPAGRFFLFTEDEGGDFAQILVALQKTRPDSPMPARLQGSYDVLTEAEPMAAERHEMALDGQDAPGPDGARAMLGTKEIVELFGVSPKTAQRWCQRFGWKQSGRWFVDRLALEAR